MVACVVYNTSPGSCDDIILGPQSPVYVVGGDLLSISLMGPYMQVCVPSCAVGQYVAESHSGWQVKATRQGHYRHFTVDGSAHSKLNWLGLTYINWLARWGHGWAGGKASLRLLIMDF